MAGSTYRSGGLRGDRVVGVGQRVLAIDVDQGRFERFEFGFVEFGIGADDHQVAGLRAVRGGAVHRDDAAAFLGADRAAAEAEAVSGLRRAGFEVDYVAVRRPDLSVPAAGEGGERVVLAAARLGRTRLIDNLGFTLGW